MTNLRDRPNTALLVVDVQNGVVANAHHRDEVISNIDTLIDKARSELATNGWSTVTRPGQQWVTFAIGSMLLSALIRRSKGPADSRYY